MTIYINIIADIRRQMVHKIQIQLSDIMASERDRLIGYSAAMCIVTIVCLALTGWYADRTHKMIRDMAQHTHSIRIKSHELALEKRRSDALLYQMMPRSVADQLKAFGEVKAEYYHSATVYTSSRSRERSRPSTTIAPPSTPAQGQGRGQGRVLP